MRPHLFLAALGLGLGGIFPAAHAAEPAVTSPGSHDAANVKQRPTCPCRTAQFGKNHEVPVWQTSPVGPFDARPTGGGPGKGGKVTLDTDRSRSAPRKNLSRLSRGTAREEFLVPCGPAHRP